MNQDPRNDQASAKERDLLRFLDLARPYMPEEDPVPQDLLGRMNPDERAEALAILERLDITADPDEERERQKILLGLAQAETHLRGILEKGDPRMRNGKILTDPQTGEILRNRNTDRSARATLRRLERLRSQITGLPPARDDQH